MEAHHSPSLPPYLKDLLEFQRGASPSKPSRSHAPQQRRHRQWRWHKAGNALLLPSGGGSGGGAGRVEGVYVGGVRVNETREGGGERGRMAGFIGEVNVPRASRKQDSAAAATCGHNAEDAYACARSTFAWNLPSSTSHPIPSNHPSSSTPLPPIYVYVQLPPLPVLLTSPGARPAGCRRCEPPGVGDERQEEEEEDGEATGGDVLSSKASHFAVPVEGVCYGREDGVNTST